MSIEPDYMRILQTTMFIPNSSSQDLYLGLCCSDIELILREDVTCMLKLGDFYALYMK